MAVASAIVSIPHPFRNSSATVSYTHLISDAGQSTSPRRCGRHVVEGHDCHILADVLRGDRVLIAGIADEAVFLYPAKIDFFDDILMFQRY